jgi:hypothetical protein
MDTAQKEAEQIPLLDLTGKEFNAMWVDDNAPLFVANNPLHWKAHKLQIALARMDKISEKNPAQFNSTSYFAALDKLADLMEQINKGDFRRDEVLGSHGVVEDGHTGTASQDSDIEPISMDS